MTKATQCKEGLSPDEKKQLKELVHAAWSQFPLDLRKVIFEAKKHKLNIMYMVENWAKENDNQILAELLARKIACSEEKLKKIEQELQG